MELEVVFILVTDTSTIITNNYIEIVTNSYLSEADCIHIDDGVWEKLLLGIQ